MKTAKELISKIKYDPWFKEKKTYLYVYDRVENRLDKLDFFRVEIKGDLIYTYDDNGTEIMIPLHRIKVIESANEILWCRLYSKY